MIKGAGERAGGRSFAFIGLTAENIRRMREGDPAVIELGDLGLPPIELIIAYGETDRHVIAELERMGKVPPGTASEMPDAVPDGSNDVPIHPRRLV